MAASLSHLRSELTWLGLVVLVVFLSWDFLNYYLQVKLNLILCLILMPFVLKVRQRHCFSFRYVYLAAISLGAYSLLHMQSLFFFSIGFTILFILESRVGKIGWLPAVLMFLLSSVSSYISDVFTFSLRLEMSEITAHWLQGIGHQVKVSGNIFFLDGLSFSVDRACMGLNSIITGLVLITLAATMSENQYKRSLTFWPLVGIYSLGLLLMLIGNQIRMLLLVLFRSPADTLGHEMIGLMCLLVYGAAPVWFGITWLLKQKKASRSWRQRTIPYMQPCSLLKWIITICLLSLSPGLGFISTNTLFQRKTEC